ncbi:hypothetical protein [Streptomyces nojiriensis]|uniref:hypothetical protein n=1 Tax=Streptomyces nojiriensis TaxID=66374 RepID=UPI00365E9F5D
MDDRLTGLLHGLVWNAAAPPDVLVRLLGLEDEWVRWVVPRTPGCGEAPRSAPAFRRRARAGCRTGRTCRKSR